MNTPLTRLQIGPALKAARDYVRTLEIMQKDAAQGCKACDHYAPGDPARPRYCAFHKDSVPESFVPQGCDDWIEVDIPF
jgi:hypothetical protein